MGLETIMETVNSELFCQVVLRYFLKNLQST